MPCSGPLRADDSWSGAGPGACGRQDPAAAGRVARDLPCQVGLGVAVQVRRGPQQADAACDRQRGEADVVVVGSFVQLLLLDDACLAADEDAGDVEQLRVQREGPEPAAVLARKEALHIPDCAVDPRLSWLHLSTSVSSLSASRRSPGCAPLRPATPGDRKPLTRHVWTQSRTVSSGRPNL